MKKLYSRAGTIEVVVSAICLASCCLLIFIAALARSVGRPFNWSQDLSLFLFAWSVFLSADVALRKDKLVRVDLLIKLFPEKPARIVTAITYLIILVFMVALVVYGIKISIISSRRVFQGIPGFSYTWLALSVPVGSLLMAITVIRKILLLLKAGTIETGGGSA